MLYCLRFQTKHSITVNIIFIVNSKLKKNQHRYAVSISLLSCILYVFFFIIRPNFGFVSRLPDSLINNPLSERLSKLAVSDDCKQKHF